MRAVRRQLWLACSLAVLVPLAARRAGAESPTVEAALRLAPIQRDLEYDRPAAKDVAECTIQAQKQASETSWVVRDPSGQMLRRFADTNGDNVVDMWCYYQNGIEVYRDIDSQRNGSKADQYRWLNTAGVRWGLDPDEDGVIDSWKQISAEEATAEAIAALGAADVRRFARLLLTEDEIGALGLGADRSRALSELVAQAPQAFAELAKKQKQVTAKTRWLHFGGTRPGVAPAESSAGSDTYVYENVLAMIDTDGKDGQVQIGTLVRVGEVWKLIDAPSIPAAGEQLTSSGFFFQPSLPPRTEGSTETADAPNDAVQKLLGELETVDQALAKASAPEEQERLNGERANKLEQLAEASGSPEDRAQWIRQLADTVSAAVQSGSYVGGAERLRALRDKLQAGATDADLLAYVEFRYLMADYGAAVQQENADFPAVQTKWLESLEKFVTDFPQSPDTAEAMLQLGIGQEYAGKDDEAKSWYERIANEFSSAPSAAKAAGAVRRIDSVGKPMQLRGKAVNGGNNAVVDVSAKPFKGNIVLIHYWATWCEPCKADLEEIKELVAKYGRGGFAAVGVSLDNKPEDLTAFLKANRLTWLQLYEPGGLDSRYANEMGILTLPTMILVDQQGKVLNRNIHAGELEKELKARLKQ